MTRKYMKRFYSYITLIFCLALPVILLAEGEKDVLIQANFHYDQGEFEKAVSLYDSLVKQDKESVSLYYNLGNAHYKLNNIALSVLNYERALKLDPGYEDARFNLQLANLKVVDRIVPERRIIRDTWLNIRNSLSAGQWGFLVVLMLWLALGLGALFLFANATMVKRVTFFGGISCLVLALIFGGIAISKRAWETSPSEAIVTVPNVYVKSSPDQGGNDLFILHEGVKVSLNARAAEWQEIELPDGKKGWLPEKSLEEI